MSSAVHTVVAQDDDAGNEPVFELSPFEVVTDEQYGYRANTSVSGTRTATAVRQLPFTLQIVTDELIDDMNVPDLEDVLLFTAGVQENRENVGNYGSFNVRGIRQLYTLRNGFRHYGPNDASTLSRVEVVKGPAGLLYGQVFPGGVVNAVTKKPLQFSQQVLEVQAGSYGTYRAVVDSTGPLNKSKSLSYRLIGTYGEIGSFVEFYERRVKSIVPMITFAPTKWLKLTLELEHYENLEDAPPPGMLAINTDELAAAIENPDDPYGLVDNPKAANASIAKPDTFNGIATWLPRSFNINGPGTYSDYTKESATLYTDIRFSDSISFRSALNYLDSENDRYGSFVSDTLRTGIDFVSRANYGINTNVVFTSQNDFFFTFDTGPIAHKLLAGGEYYRDKFTNYKDSEVRRFARLPSPYDFITRGWASYFQYLVPIRDFERSPRPEELTGLEFNIGEETTGHAYYFVDQLTFFNERAHVVAGTRYESYETNFGADSGKNSNWTYQGGAMFDLVDWISIFASYSESFYRNGFLKDNFIDPDLRETMGPPQLGDGIDIGFKWETAGGRLAGTMSYFDLAQTNIPLDVVIDDENVQVLAGERTSTGFEFDLHYAPVPHWQVIFNYTYLDAIDVDSGSEMPNVPTHQANLWTRYEFLEGRFEGVFLGGGARYLGDRPAGNETNLFNRPNYVFDAKAYTHIDVFMGKEFEFSNHTLQLQFNITNLTDEKYIRGGQLLPSEPRRYLLSLKSTW
ncbi:MAG: TonB-dependent siderophore receptor [Puniceicoccaceae bacterium]